jgi:hypothetical protein
MHPKALAYLACIQREHFAGLQHVSVSTASGSPAMRPAAQHDAHVREKTRSQVILIFQRACRLRSLPGGVMSWRTAPDLLPCCPGSHTWCVATCRDVASWRRLSSLVIPAHVQDRQPAHSAQRGRLEEPPARPAGRLKGCLCQLRALAVSWPQRGPCAQASCAIVLQIAATRPQSYHDGSLRERARRRSSVAATHTSGAARSVSRDMFVCGAGPCLVRTRQATLAILFIFKLRCRSSSTMLLV